MTEVGAQALLLMDPGAELDWAELSDTLPSVVEKAQTLIKTSRATTDESAGAAETPLGVGGHHKDCSADGVLPYQPWEAGDVCARA